jgi:hypothetical protein
MEACDLATALDPFDGVWLTEGHEIAVRLDLARQMRPTP